jgi:hypothetical protein
MPSETDGQRNFTLREKTGEETSVFSGKTPRQAALKAARRLDIVHSLLRRQEILIAAVV